MDFEIDMKKLRKKKSPRDYKFLLNESNQILNQVLKITKEEHEKNLQKCKEEITRWQRAVGGQVIHRGYYCPSRIEDVVIGNNNRGRLIKRKTAKSERELSYEYGFCNERLIFIRHTYDEGIQEREYILYSGNKQIGYTFDSNMRLRTISECTYQDNKLMSYLRIHVFQDNSVSECVKELYEYEEGMLHSVLRYYLVENSDCECAKYIFKHDEEGFCYHM